MKCFIILSNHEIRLVRIRNVIVASINELSQAIEMTLALSLYDLFFYYSRRVYSIEKAEIPPFGRDFQLIYVFHCHNLTFHFTTQIFEPIFFSD